MKTTNLLRSTLFLIFVIAIISVGEMDARTKKESKKRTKKGEVEVVDTTSKKPAMSSYQKLLVGAKSHQGMFTIHRVGTKIYFEIADSLLGRDFLLSNKLSRVSEEFNTRSLNKGMEYQRALISFDEDTLYKKIRVRYVNAHVHSPSEDAIHASVLDNYSDVFFEQFDIKGRSADSLAVLIDVTSIFDGSNKSFNDPFRIFKIKGSTSKELSVIELVKSFPENIVIKSSFSGSETQNNMKTDLSLTTTTNIVLLPKEPMKVRYGDVRMGVFSEGHTYFHDEQQQAEYRDIIRRWRLEPREEDVESYLAGELVEPQKQIVFYIDPATPPKWVPYIKQAIEDWQGAFEGAGFKSAIVAKESDPEVDTDFDVEDVRYSVVTYVASEMMNAMGPSVIDPRSGEIIESDIVWWHNVMKLAADWITIQTGATNSDVRNVTLPDSVMGECVRFIAAHEVGHTLGLMHNFAASQAFAVDSLRSKTFTDTYGVSPSIMDYARFNYVAQPGDGVISFVPKIGVYDRYAIDWAYRWFDTEGAEQDVETLNGMITKHDGDRRYWYGAQTFSDVVDPRSQSEDLGDDAIKASGYGVANLKRVVPNIVEWTYEEGKQYFKAGELLASAVGQWSLYMGHVLTNVGGIYLNNPTYQSDQAAYGFVDRGYQKRAVAFLLKEAFTTPEWLFGAEVWSKSYYQRVTRNQVAEYSPYNMARARTGSLYASLLSERRLLRMIEAEIAMGRGKSYTVEELMSDLIGGVFVGKGARSLTVYERMNQKAFVDVLIATTKIATKADGTLLSDEPQEHWQEDGCCDFALFSPMELAQAKESDELRMTQNFEGRARMSETVSARRGALNQVLAIAKTRANSGDTATRNHYKDLQTRIEETNRGTAGM